MSTIVQFDEVGLRYGQGDEVLSDVSFALAAGEFYFLTGASGAGKTSLLKLLYLAQRPTRGRIRLFNTEMVSLPRKRMPGFRRRLGVVYQDFRLVPHLSVADNVALPLRIFGMHEDEIRAATSEMLAWVGLQHRAGARPETLSGGEQQRVAIARAVITRPELLIADEPTGNVDDAMADRLMQLFTSLNGIGTTVVIATHDLALLSGIATAHLMHIENGRLQDPTGALRYPPRRGAGAAS